MSEELAARVTEGLQAENAQLREKLFEEQTHAAEMERCAVECAAANERLKAQLAEAGGWKDASVELPPDLGQYVEVQSQGYRTGIRTWFVSDRQVNRWRPLAGEGGSDE